MSIIYEITATVDESLTAQFERYMTERHIPDLLSTGNFTAAFFARNDDVYRISYHADSRSRLEDYLATHAERLRTDFAEHFPAGVEVSRQTFEVVKFFSNE